MPPPSVRHNLHSRAWLLLLLHEHSELTKLSASARNGANIVLHHLGVSTRVEAEEVQKEIQRLGRRCVLVEGDISEVATSESVSTARYWTSSLHSRPTSASRVNTRCYERAEPHRSSRPRYLLRAYRLPRLQRRDLHPHALPLHHTLRRLQDDLREPPGPLSARPSSRRADDHAGAEPPHGPERERGDD
jgi:hypothetical protein